ncbi:two-component system sensor histidine kinase VanS [Clostridium tetanomorphum]|nr:HAMP domain-containing sensor histidine kinase [Clostridium tetanomorphum]KAJ50723.1 sensor protein [Clostridium tetanomorphum DSM 665]MBP1862797.1 two-component system sensor histidine kinase VanS [Clostridium tetanomorphum]NRS85364.1 two-component system sensor histidine kinase VanS [Clostridium tetanomorphum]NRZ98541.1 two-component system sensor histidine kinase VanS [Clostridium tetanomorphum]
MKNEWEKDRVRFNKVYRQLLLRVLSVVIIYTTLGIAAYLLTANLLRQFAGQNELLLQIFAWIELHRGLGALVYIVVGYGAILLYYWNKPFQYLHEVLNAAENIFQHTNELIELSAPLKDAEIYLNQLKISVQNNERVAQEAEQRKNDLIEYLAHDLKTPLTSVIGYLSLLDEALDMPVEQKAKYVHITLDKAKRLEKLINEFFEITRYDLQNTSLEKETIDLYYMLVQMTDEFYPVLSAHGNTIKLDANEDLTVYGDSVKLARVFNNILKNAISYSYPDTEIIVGAKAIDASVQITFCNHGKTIPASKLDAIFDKFFRLDETRATNTGGAGLGLAIAKEIITLHGGSIIAESENEITTFFMTLPISC